MFEPRTAKQAPMLQICIYQEAAELLSLNLCGAGSNMSLPLNGSLWSLFGPMSAVRGRELYSPFVCSPFDSRADQV